ncbi:glycerophosphodiester phosphodiesterase [Pelagibacterium sp. 26DY04]|uniref:glycerophosphodiester phosphodiesterase n=1 Tax=Pelagibacterium sp. 26DY04 TaxID=2967130 RepID=UPI0028169A75|nr:glycerophosphodiester phosphodiesterase family protein [Pelagibacterium sp. 26DY04]WMT86376.1 glycerophosphodiester phosphodiesterase [Pelagibacterium sp. 26DY04]
MNHCPAIVAHRGFSARFRENSAAAWLGAIAAHADIIEIDLRATADLEIVCAHDATLERLSGHRQEIAAIAASALDAIRIAGEPVAPRLSQVFKTIPPTTGLLFDIKDERIAVLNAILGALSSYDDHDITLGLHTVESIAFCRKAGWAGGVLALLGDMSTKEAAFAAGSNILRVWESDASDDYIAQCLELGPVWVTVGEHDTGRKVGDFAAADLVRMARAGVSGFLVNDPEAARAVLAR